MEARGGRRRAGKRGWWDRVEGVGKRLGARPEQESQREAQVWEDADGALRKGQDRPTIRASGLGPGRARSREMNGFRKWWPGKPRGGGAVLRKEAAWGLGSGYGMGAKGDQKNEGTREKDGRRDPKGRRKV